MKYVDIFDNKILKGHFGSIDEPKVEFLFSNMHIWAILFGLTGFLMGFGVYRYSTYIIYFLLPLAFLKFQFQQIRIIHFIFVGLLFIAIHSCMNEIEKISFIRGVAPVNEIYILTFTIIFPLMVLCSSTLIKFISVYAYFLGIIFNSFLIAIYSLLYGGSEFGYSILIDPFNNDYINSPAISNNIAIWSGICLFGAFFYKNAYRQFFILAFIISLVFGIYLGGRSFFVIILISLFYGIFYNPHNLKSILFGASLSAFGVMALLSLSTVLSGSLEFLLDRFSDNGLDSDRWRVLGAGIELVFSEPQGGFEVPLGLSHFHNVFLDFGRLGGLLSFISLSCVFVISVLSMIRGAGIVSHWLSLLCLLTWSVMMQDVIIDGNWRLLCLMSLSTIVLLSKKSKNFH
jgi:hypothetical protein